MTRTATLLFYLALAGLLLGCHAFEPPETAWPYLAMGQTGAPDWPPNAKLTQRVFLKVGKREWDFTGYVWLREDAPFRALALGPMGVSLFQFEGDSALRLPPRMPEKPIEKGVIPDLLHVFQPRPHPDFLVELDAQNRWTTSYRKQENDWTTRVEYEGWTVIGLEGQTIPTQIRLENKRWGYLLDVDILRWDYLDPPPR